MPFPLDSPLSTNLHLTLWVSHSSHGISSRDSGLLPPVGHGESRLGVLSCIPRGDNLEARQGCRHMGHETGIMDTHERDESGHSTLMSTPLFLSRGQAIVITTSPFFFAANQPRHRIYTLTGSLSTRIPLCHSSDKVH